MYTVLRTVQQLDVRLTGVYTVLRTVQQLDVRLTGVYTVLRTVQQLDVRLTGVYTVLRTVQQLDVRLISGQQETDDVVFSQAFYRTHLETLKSVFSVSYFHFVEKVEFKLENEGKKSLVAT